MAFKNNFVWRDGKLEPLDGVLDFTETQDVEKAYVNYGFEFPRMGINFSAHEDLGIGDGMRVLGPNKRDDAEYEFVCDYTVGDHCYFVWIKDFAELHSYLNQHAPLMWLFQGQMLMDCLRAVDKWIFSARDGILANHIREREAMEQRQLEYYQRKAKEAKEKATQNG